MKPISLLLMTIFLAGCGFNGIMPEVYDGERLEVNAEAVELYKNESKLTNDNFEDRYHFLDTTVNQTAEDSGETVMISSGSYEIGADIEEGRYQVDSGETNAGAFVTYDSEGERLVEIAMSYYSPDIVLDLVEGMELEYKVRHGEVELIPIGEMMMTGGPDGIYTVPAGIHEAGKHLETGDYALMSNEIPIQRVDGDSDIHVNYKTTYSSVDGDPALNMEEMDVEESLVTLNEGDMIITEYPITIRKE